MKLSVMTYSIAQQYTKYGEDDFIPAIAQAGVSGINWVGTYSKTAAEWRKKSMDAGLEISCYTFALDSLTFGKGDMMAEAEKNFSSARELGVTRVMVVPIPMAGVNGRLENQARWIEVFHRLLPLAKAAGTVLTTENFQGEASPFVTAADLQAARREVTDLRFTLDVGNAALGENPLQTIRQCADAIEFVHFKDWTVLNSRQEGATRGLDGKEYFPALIGEGDIPLQEALGVLRQSGYDGFIDIEYEGGKYPAPEAIRLAADRLKNWLNKEK